MIFLAYQNIQLNRELKSIVANSTFSIDAARRDYLRDLNSYYMQGCYKGSYKEVDYNGSTGDWCKDGYKEQEPSIIHDLDRFAKPRPDLED